MLRTSQSLSNILLYTQKVAKNPAAQKAAQKTFENPALQRAVSKEVAKSISTPPPPPPSSPPSSPSEAPGWLKNVPKAEAVPADIENASSSNSQVVSDFSIEEPVLKEMSRWHLAIRVSYMISAILLGTMAGLSLVNQKDLGLIFFAFYVMFFSLLICCFELALSVSISKQIKITLCNFNFS